MRCRGTLEHFEIFLAKERKKEMRSRKSVFLRTDDRGLVSELLEDAYASDIRPIIPPRSPDMHFCWNFITITVYATGHFYRGMKSMSMAGSNEHETDSNGYE